jgi:hypothetical protein
VTPSPNHPGSPSHDPSPTDTPAAYRAADPTRLNPDNAEGTAILRLFSEIKSIEHGDGSWPGGDVVAIVQGWFAGLGIDVDASAQQVNEDLHRGPRPYTVLALRDNDSHGDALVAGVVRGDIPRVDRARDSGGLQRVVETVLAEDPHRAEILAYKSFEAARAED